MAAELKMTSYVKYGAFELNDVNEDKATEKKKRDKEKKRPQMISFCQLVILM